MMKATSVEQYKLVTSYESIRRKLLDQKYADRLDKPLAYWALPNDRRLPLAFLDRTLSDLLSRPFDELSATPGIGQKKIGAMIKLLLRAASDESPDVPFGIRELAADQQENGEARAEGAANGFDPSLVSESQWVRWKETIRRHQVEHEKIGRLAPALNDVPTVIWHTPLSFYLPHSVAEVRQLRTHGEKRVGVVLEVFHLVHRVLHLSEAVGHLTVRLVPKFAIELENWLASAVEAGDDVLPDEQQVRKNLALPLLRQSRLDVGESVIKLAEGRLGVRGKPQSVRSQSRRMGVTRARVYQLLDECGKAMAVRWPEGRCLLTALAEKYNRAEVAPSERRMFDAARQLFFPDKFAEEERKEEERKEEEA